MSTPLDVAKRLFCFNLKKKRVRKKAPIFSKFSDFQGEFQVANCLGVCFPSKEKHSPHRLEARNLVENVKAANHAGFSRDIRLMGEVPYENNHPSSKNSEKRE